MKTGEALFENYQKLRDYSGGELDSYAQNLLTFLMHAQSRADFVHRTCTGNFI